MTATIGGLLDRLHLLAYRLDPSGPPLPVETAHLAAGWAQVSQRLTAALKALPFEFDGTGEAQRDYHLSLLRPLRGPTEHTTPADPQLEDAALLFGGIADMLVDHHPRFQVDAPPRWFYPGLPPRKPVYEWRDRNEAAATALQDNLLAATYAIGNWTLHRLGTNGTDSTPFARSLRHLVNTCHQAARTNPDRRRSSLEHLTSTPVDEPSLYGALTRWATEAEKALHRRLVTSGTFAMLASDLTILTAATHHTLTPRMHKELEDLQEVTKTLTAALTGWKQIAAWPTNMRLGGPRALDYIAASRELRSYIAAELTGPDGWHTASQIQERFTTGQLDTLTQTLAQRSARMGDALSKTVRDMTIGQGRMWVDTSTARTVDPDLRRTRWILQADGAPPVAAPIDWHISRRPTERAIQLADTSREAANHSEQAATRIHQLLGFGHKLTPEVVSRVTLSRARIRVRYGHPGHQTGTMPPTFG
ncbi:hypothetical protein BJY21_003217 [Kineosphaera limosa]|uniref:Uncharacterized protein n=1 Tax=Kineosphaera limosa NBRC 100340 TaxID=1184609 RepID=K6WVQ7_9MICO|nr:hypothetical protein [Kineosphaera limosa]NYE02033.1 hypothetical protein [Kineosphaera limosa]GAB97901.1 hypothetical protein KILIM_087_00060 [Kineosphaera limosa NBRC 100340]